MAKRLFDFHSACGCKLRDDESCPLCTALDGRVIPDAERNIGVEIRPDSDCYIRFQKLWRSPSETASNVGQTGRRHLRLVGSPAVKV
jgi:hypothetical protein